MVVYFLHSDEARFQAMLTNFKRYILKDKKDTKVFQHEVDALAPQSTREVCMEIINKCRKEGFDRVVLNVTGGTKLMAFGARQIGGIFANKILITTKENFHHSKLVDRAKSMNIQLISIEDIMKDPQVLLRCL